MSVKKRTSRVLDHARLRSAGLKAIDANMDFGDARNLKNMTQLIDQLRSQIDALNTALVVVDSSKDEIKQLEKKLSELSENMLIAVAFRYGKDSREYEMAGGVRKSERIRRSIKSRLKARPEEGSPDPTKTV